ncbi:MAG: phage virion morphogenesis protein [Pseudohongiella sp.]|nr:phage virion morphogenesis protein [Pseudohongiella sp.]
MRFLYKKPSGEERVAEISSYQNQGDRVTGYDVEAGGLRTFIRDRMQQHMKPKSAGGPGSLRERKGSIRRQAMFSKIRMAKNLRATATEGSALVGFVGRVADIARIHQYGLRDQVNSSGTQVRYEKRELLGFTDKDVQSVLNLLVDHLGNQ